MLKGKVLVVGIGNVLRGDDGAGPELLRELKNSLPSSAPAPHHAQSVERDLQKKLPTVNRQLSTYFIKCW